MDYPSDYSPLRPGGTPLTRRLLALGGELRGRRVLDLGCGRGETAALLAREYGAVVTGADLSEERIRECREMCPDGTFAAADAGDLPFADGTFDAVVSECSFSVFPAPETALGEAYRVLAAGGRLLISDLWQRGALPTGRGMVRNLYSRRTWEDMLAAAGFCVTAFADAGDALTGLYIQMILDLGREGAARAMGLCLEKEEMKQVSYMLLAAGKNRED